MKLTKEQINYFNENYIITTSEIQNDFYHINENGVFSYESTEREYDEDFVNFLVVLKNKKTNEIIYQHQYSTDMIIDSLMSSWTKTLIESNSIESFIEKIKNTN